MTKEKKFRYSEIFGRTIQGEGLYTGIPSVFLRTFGCNFECNGFGQDDPTDPSSYDLPKNRIDLTDITDMNQLPMLTKGCDSAYSYAARFRHLAPLETAADICDKIEKELASKSNPEGKFKHPVSSQDTHFVITGGEPIMSQHAILAIMKELEARDNVPHFVTVETNGTQKVKKPLATYITKEFSGTEWFWSLSPKLFTTSGEKTGIRPEIVQQYTTLDPILEANGQLKFVVNGSDETWNELDEAIAQYRDYGIDWDVWIMPVGADGESQEQIQAEICEEAFDRGYNFAARVHSWVFNNAMGK